MCMQPCNRRICKKKRKKGGEELVDGCMHACACLARTQDHVKGSRTDRFDNTRERCYGLLPWQISAYIKMTCPLCD